MKKLALSASILLMTAPVAFAQNNPFGNGPTTGGTGKGTQVPEINALAGVAAVAALAAVVALIWERRKAA